MDTGTDGQREGQMDGQSDNYVPLNSVRLVLRCVRGHLIKEWRSSFASDFLIFEARVLILKYVG